MQAKLLVGRLTLQIISMCLTPYALQKLCCVAEVAASTRPTVCLTLFVTRYALNVWVHQNHTDVSQLAHIKARLAVAS